MSIVIENNAEEHENRVLKTTKENSFLHGYGIKNIKEAVERYDGTCIIEAKQNRFVLKIIIPLME